MKRIYVIDYYEVEKINEVIYAEHNLYDGGAGGYGIELFENISDVEEQLISISREIKNKKIKHEPMSIFVNVYEIRDGYNFQDIVKKIQEYNEWDGYDEELEEYTEILPINDYIDNMEELDFEEHFSIYQNNRFENDIVDFFSFSIVDYIVDYVRSFKEKDDIENIKNEISNEVIKRFSFLEVDEMREEYDTLENFIYDTIRKEAF